MPSFRLSLLVLLLAAIPLSAADRDGVELAARRYVALAYEGQFTATVDDAPGRELFERRLRNILRVRCVAIENIRIDQLSVENDAATVEMTIALRKADRRTPDIRLPIETVPLRLHFIRREQQWLVSRFGFPDEELADRLLAAGDPAPILNELPHRMTRNLARTLYERATARILRSDVLRAEPAANLAREVSLRAGDRGGEALAMLIASSLAWGRNGPAEARELVDRAFAIAEESGDPDAIALALTEKGMAGAQDAATREAQLRRAVAIAEHAENPVAMVRALHVQAARAFIRNDYLTTRALLERSVPYMRDGADTAGRIWYDVQIAYIYFFQGDYEQALHHLERGLALAEATDAWIRAYALNRLADIRLAQGRYDEALEAIEQARAAMKVPSSGITAMIMEQTATIEAARGNLEEAECLVRASDPYWRAAQYEYGPALDVVVPHLAKRGEHLTALRFSLEQAANVQTLLPAQAVRSLTSAAEAYRALGQPERAMATIREAIAMREELHERTAGGERQRVRSAEWTAACYELAAEIALDTGRVEEALALIERGRGRVLYDAVHDGDRALRDDEASKHHEQLLAALNLELARAERNDDDAAARGVRARLDRARREHQTLLDGIRVREAGDRIARPDVSLQEIASALPDGLAVVEYVVRDDRLHAFVVRNGAVAHHATKIDRTDLDARVQAYADMLASRDLRHRKTAKDLYSLLIAPIERELRGADAICIVPDESLWRIPFAALLDREGRFLIERAAIFYAPSATVYTAIAERRAEREAGGILALANPLVDAEANQQITSIYRGVTLGALPDAEREVDAICATYGAERCTSLRRAEATEERVRSSIAGARVVHFATHAVLDDGNPMYSRLVLAGGSGAADDGSLEVWEIARLDLDADLVVLSACETARGTIGSGEGVVGMAWAFFVAGARSTLATQWKVASASSAELMIGFHRSLHRYEGDRAMKKALALRDAQLRMLRNGRTRHPFYWAGFVMLGDAS